MRFVLIALCLVLFPAAAFAQTDEIQVYDGHLADPGVFNLTLHSNYIAKGSKSPAFPGGLVANHSFNGVPEWAYGVTNWFEAGLYLPLYSDTPAHGFGFNGFKLRALFAEPDAAQKTFVYGVNFEFSYNSRHWNTNRYTSEIRPIIGWHLGQWDLIFNPILDNDWSSLGSLDFAPASRVAYNFTPAFALAVEEYDDFGPLRRFFSAEAQSHQLFLVADYDVEPVSVETGIGFGLTQASDNLVLKLILSHDLN